MSKKLTQKFKYLHYIIVISLVLAPNININIGIEIPVTGLIAKTDKI